MTTKEYLGQIRNIDNRIRDKIEEAERWRNIACKTGNSSMSENKVQTSKSFDPMGDAVSLAVDYEKESMQMSIDLTKLKHKIIWQIDNIGDDLYYNILKSYYIKQNSLMETSHILYYSYKQLKRHYEDALKMFEEKYGNEYAGECPVMSINVQ